MLQSVFSSPKGNLWREETGQRTPKKTEKRRNKGERIKLGKGGDIRGPTGPELPEVQSSSVAQIPHFLLEPEIWISVSSPKKRMQNPPKPVGMTLPGPELAEVAVAVRPAARNVCGSGWQPQVGRRSGPVC